MLFSVINNNRKQEMTEAFKLFRTYHWNVSDKRKIQVWRPVSNKTHDQAWRLIFFHKETGYGTSMGGVQNHYWKRRFKNTSITTLN